MSGVHPKTSDLIRDRIREHGFFPDEIARQVVKIGEGRVSLTQAEEMLERLIDGGSCTVILCEAIIDLELLHGADHARAREGMQ